MAEVDTQPIRGGGKGGGSKEIQYAYRNKLNFGGIIYAWVT